MLAKMQGGKEPYTLLMEMSEATMEISMEVPQKT
jgi:hypothetical protein